MPDTQPPKNDGKTYIKPMPPSPPAWAVEAAEVLRNSGLFGDPTGQGSRDCVLPAARRIAEAAGEKLRRTANYADTMQDERDKAWDDLTNLRATHAAVVEGLRELRDRVLSPRQPAVDALLAKLKPTTPTQKGTDAK